MTTHQTLEEAREASKAIPESICILLIDHLTEGQCYIVCKGTMSMLQEALTRKPKAEVKKLIAEYPIAEESLRCERCDAKVTNSDYHQRERMYIAYYCPSCARLLKTIGMGEVTEMEERQYARYSPELSHPADY